MDGRGISRRGALLATVLVLVVAVVAAFIAGRWSDGDDRDTRVDGKATAPAASPAARSTVWTCSMHPQIRQSGPGKCPICGMPLIPADASSGKSGAVVLAPGAQARLGVRTVPVQRRSVTKEILAVGKVQQNETAVSTVTSRVDGYVERLFVDYTGIEVDKGDHLVEIYSPDLVVAQQELLIAARSSTSPSLVEATRAKLLRWELTPEQIDEVLRTRKPKDRITLFSPVAGTVIEKKVVEKSAVKAGDVLYQLVNLESVWVNLDIYEFEGSWVQAGQPVQIRAEAFPGRTFAGRVTFVSPLLDEMTRTIKVRVNVSNRERKLKPGMFVNANLRVPLQSDGSAGPTGLEGQFTCPMHPEIVRPKPGACPVCGMPLARLPGKVASATKALYRCPMHPEVTSDRPGTCPKCGMALERIAADDGHQLLTVPASAILDSGTRRLVYIEAPPGSFRPVEVQVGPRSGDIVPVLSGLKGTERVVERGAFLIDSEAQIRDLPSLLSMPVAVSSPGAAPPSAGPGTAPGKESMPMPMPSGGSGSAHQGMAMPAASSGSAHPGSPMPASPGGRR